MNKQLLIIDNDLSLCHQLNEYFSPEGFTTSFAQDGETGLKMALNQMFEAVILEILLPKKNGLDVLKAIREYSNVPILFLTGREDDVDKLLALRMGADDYLLKPCDPDELIARLSAVLRRTTMHHSSPVKRLIEYQGLKVDCGRRTVIMDGAALELTNTEFNILEILIKSPGQAFSKEELTEYAMGRKFTAYDRSIDVHISNLRNKLGDNPDEEPWIKTVRGFGYLFNVSVNA